MSSLKYFFKGCFFLPNYFNTQYYEAEVISASGYSKKCKYVGASPKPKESIAVIWANARRQADLGNSNELHLY